MSESAYTACQRLLRGLCVCGALSLGGCVGVAGDGEAPTQPREPEAARDEAEAGAGPTLAELSAAGRAAYEAGDFEGFLAAIEGAQALVPGNPRLIYSTDVTTL